MVELTWNDPPVCDKLKHQKRCSEVLFVLRVKVFLVAANQITGTGLCPMPDTRAAGQNTFFQEDKQDKLLAEVNFNKVLFAHLATRYE